MDNTPIHFLFVYGSLRSGFRSPAYEYITRFFDLAGEGRVKGRLFDLGEYPAGKPSDDHVFIVGELCVARNQSEFSWAIAQLDDYEGVLGEEGEAPLYRRELTDVYIGDSVTRAWIYWYNGDVTGKPVVESGDIMEYLSKK